MKDNNVTVIVVAKTSWKNAHYIPRKIVVVETPRTGRSPENTKYNTMKKVLNQMVLIFKLLLSYFYMI